MEKVHGVISELCVGDYYLSELEDGSFWIASESGEGMQVSEETLEKVIDDFFKENF